MNENEKDRLVCAFSSALGIPKDEVIDELQYDTIPEWDSVSHMQLVAEIEDEFGILMETSDILNLSSVSKALEILSKYDVKTSE